MNTHVLYPHPDTPCSVLQTLTVRLQVTAQAWQLRYVLTGQLARLRLPARPKTPGPRDGLWQHSCLELFAGHAADTVYHEFNLSPAGDWAAYAFTDERQRASPHQITVQPQLRWQRASERAVLEVTLPRSALPRTGAAGDTSWRVGLSAVIESLEGELSYWALQHPAERPDFHDRAGWVTISLP